MSEEFPDETISRYDRWFKTPFGRRAAAMEKQVLAEVLPPGEGRTLLDIGCGTGHFTEWIRDRGYDVTAVEPSERMLKIARQRLGDEIAVRRMWAELLRFPSGRFDTALMMTTLEFTEDPAHALREAIRVARNAVVIGVLNPYNPLAVWRKLTSLITGGTYRHARFFSAGQLARMCRQAAEEAGRDIVINWTGGVCLGQMLMRRPIRSPAAAFIGMRVELSPPAEPGEPDDEED